MVGIVAGISIAPTGTDLQKVYKDYNHIKIEEDGSYTGETIDGTPISGCIKNAICGSQKGYYEG